jgi:hypothetical protein
LIHASNKEYGKFLTFPAFTGAALIRINVYSGPRDEYRLDKQRGILLIKAWQQLLYQRARET